MADSNTTDPVISNQIQEIHGYLNKKYLSLKFPADLERSFKEEILPVKKQRFMRLGLIGVFFYTLFCVSDWIMLPDIYLTAWKIRIGIVCPLLILILFCMHLKLFDPYIDYAMGFAMTIASVGHAGIHKAHMVHI